MPEMRDLNDTCLGLKSKNLYVLCICISVPCKRKQWTHSERFIKLPNSSKKHGNEDIVNTENLILFNKFMICFSVSKAVIMTAHVLVPFEDGR